MKKPKKTPLERAVSMPIHPYGGDLYVTRDRAEFAEMVNEVVPGEPGAPDDCQGYFFGSEGRYLVFWGKDTGEVTLVHELAHVALSIAGHTCWDPRECNGEPFCYLLGHMIREVLSMFEAQDQAE